MTNFTAQNALHLRAQKVMTVLTVTQKGKKEFWPRFSWPDYLPNYYTKSKTLKTFISSLKLCFYCLKQWFSFISYTKANKYSTNLKKCIYTTYLVGFIKPTNYFFKGTFLQKADQVIKSKTRTMKTKIASAAPPIYTPKPNFYYFAFIAIH